MKILIVAAGNNYNNEKLNKYADECEYIICADGGFDHLYNNGVMPDLLVGDFDSVKNKPDIKNKITLPVEKDETDTLFALKKAFEKKPDEIFIYAGIGTRFDHSYANVCLLNLCLEKNIKAVLTDGFNRVYLIDDDMEFQNETGNTVSIYSFSEECEGVTLEGFKYPLKDFTLKKYNLIGTSNIIEEKNAKIKIKSGKILVVCNEKENV